MSASPLFRGNFSALTETEDSPSWSFGEKVTATRKFHGTYTLCLAYAPAAGTIPAGDLDLDGLLVESSTVQKIGDRAILTINYAGLIDESNVPPDEWGMAFSRVNLAIEKHPDFEPYFTGSYEELGRLALEAINALLRCKTDEERAAVTNQGIVLDENNAAYEQVYYLIYWLRMQGIHNFASFAPAVTRKTFHTDAPATESGGYVESPPGPDVTLPTDAEWLRQGDSVTWNGSYWVKTSTWQGAPEWDSNLYPTP